MAQERLVSNEHDDLMIESVIDDVRNTNFMGDADPLNSRVLDTRRERIPDGQRDETLSNIFGDSRFADFEKLISGGKTRKDRYKAYREAQESNGIVARVLEIYATYSASGSAIEPVKDGAGSTFSVRFENDALKEELAEASRKSKLDAEATSIIHRMCWMGDDFLELVYNRSGFDRLQRIPPEHIARNERVDGTLPADKAFLYQDPLQGSDEVHMRRFQVCHFRMGSDLDPGYGESILKPVIEDLNEWQLMKRGQVISRLTRAHQKLVHLVDVGNLEGKQAEAHVRRVKREHTTHRKIDPSSGRTRLTHDMLLNDQNLFIGTGPNRVSGIQPIPGDPSVSNIADLVEFFRWILAALCVPEAWLGLTGPNIRNVIDEQVLGFMRRCRQIRRYFERGATEIYYHVLTSWGINPDWLMNNDLIFTWPTMTHADDEAYMQLMMLRGQVATIYRTNNLLPLSYIYTQIMGMTDDEATEVLEKLEKQRQENAEKQMQQMQQMQAMGGQPQGPQKEGQLPGQGSQTSAPGGAQKGLNGQKGALQSAREWFQTSNITESQLAGQIERMAQNNSHMLMILEGLEQSFQELGSRFESRWAFDRALQFAGR